MVASITGGFSALAVQLAGVESRLGPGYVTTLHHSTMAKTA